ncbi:MAG: SUMF1/EgtB/PvdO family nonheme iron enzyme [Myxococcales bacterium]|nr:SUMF1/EgtB/PvdO family nonheme iron enzyme [Myxococcales bacterium]
MSTTDDPLALVGTVLADKYAIESVVGSGGFAVVYRATHQVWKRPVAVKVFTALGDVPTDQRQKLLDDFIQEGALLAELSERSTAIVQARDVGVATIASGESVPYMVLEWLEGKPLDEVLFDERSRGLPLRTLEQAVQLLDAVAEALALAHKKGIAHRDVKPANVFVLGDPRAAAPAVKLLDFGIAKVVQDVQKMAGAFNKTSGQITSFTPLYGAPEQFNRAYGATGPWTDVFALALVLGEVLSGREPMAGDTLVQLAYASADVARRPSPRTLGAVVPDAVEAVALRALAVSPEARFQTAGEFWSALRQAALGGPAVDIASSRPDVMAALPNAATVVAPSSAPTELAPIAASGPRSTDLVAASGAPPTPAPASKVPLLVGAGVAALLVVGGGAFWARGRGASTAPSATAEMPSATAPPASASAAATDAGSPCPEGMAAIPGGDFFMGSDERDAFDVEKPAHKVHLSPYCLDIFEVTVADYKACSDKGDCQRSGKDNEWPGITAAQRKIYDPLCNFPDFRDLGPRGRHPMNCVDWSQAQAFCEKTGRRLPTEAEWELGARGPDGRIYPWGDALPSAAHLNACGTECVAWMLAHPDPDLKPKAMYDADDGFPNTAPVGSFPQGASRYGIQDVVGNVWEWVADFHAEYDKSPAPVLDNPKGPATGDKRVLRGGGWNGSEASWVRPTFRFSAHPKSRGYAFGFRCAKSLPTK